MAESLLDVLERLNDRIKELAARNAGLATRNAELEASNAELRREAEEAREARKRAELDVEYLAVSHKLADDPDTLIATRRHISQMIRNIDRCLEMLKE